jgi:FkbM family methyltransferase
MIGTVSLTMVDGVRVVVPDSLALITPYVLIEQQDWFEDELRFLRRLLLPGQKIVDIGANHGVYALSMAKSVGPTGRVWAFEPASSTAKLLAAGIAANGFSHVVLDQSALSDHKGTAELSLQGNSELNSLVNESTPVGARETVALTTLDDRMELYAWHDLDFVKIDAEGEESNILKGGRRFFSELSPLIEYEIKAGAKLNVDLVHEFAALGYASYRLVPGLDLLVPFDPTALADGYLLNLFACKPDRAAQLEARGHLLCSSANPMPQGERILIPTHASDDVADAYGWRRALLALPYAGSLQSMWEQTVPEGHSVDVLEGLRFHALSRDPARAASERFHALQSSLDLLSAACERRPSFLRLASLARVAHEYGARSTSVEALGHLCTDIMQNRQMDPREPFLAPSERFDRLPVVGPIGNWVLAAALEEWERRGTFSSFYAGAAAGPRLENIALLGYASEEMLRRRQLVRARFGTAVPIAAVAR